MASLRRCLRLPLRQPESILTSENIDFISPPNLGYEFGIKRGKLSKPNFFPL